MLKFLMLLLIMFIIPTIIGLGIISFSKKSRKSIFLGLIVGMMFEFAICQLFSIPMRFSDKYTFMDLRNAWFISMLILTALGVLRIPSYYKDFIDETKETLTEIPKILTLVVIIAISFQCYVSFKYMHQDGDDATFVVNAVVALDNNSLKQFYRTGTELEKYDTRTLLSPYYFYEAIIGSLTSIHPTIICHTVFPVIFIIYAYCTYYLLGTALFDEDKEKTMVFMLLMCVIIIWGDYSRYSVPLRLLLRLWQGKSVLVSIIVPFIWYMFLEYLCTEKDWIYWFILLITSCGSVLTSSMSFALIPMEILALSFIYMIKDRKISYMFKSVLSIMPIVAFGVVYLIVK